MTAQFATEDTRDLVKEINEFCDKHGIAVSTFGRHAVNDGKFLTRISRGGWIAPETAKRARDFMEHANRGGIVLRGRPRRKKAESNAYSMAQLVNQETSIRTPGNYAIHEQRHRSHVFSATTNISWVQADLITSDLLKMTPSPDGLRLFYSPMDNGITLVRALRALHANFPDLPVQVVIKGWGLEDLRNTMGRMVDRLYEHPLTVLVLTNLYTREVPHLSKTAAEGPTELSWHDFALQGKHSYDFQQQIAGLFPKLAPEWSVIRGDDGFPVYSCPSVVAIYRDDHRKSLSHLIPRQDGPDLAFDYCFLNHPYLHSHTMRFRVEYILAPIIRHLAPGGQMKVVQSTGEDPAHEIIRHIFPDQTLNCISRHDIISELRKFLGSEQKELSFSGLTDTRSLYRFDMHTLPEIAADDERILPLQEAWNNAVFFSQLNEELAQSAVYDGTRYLDVTEKILRQHKSMWFVNEAFAVTRKA
ncbi:MAG: hypothetical protein AAF468_20960 [Pseudomonadota bacterium]